MSAHREDDSDVLQDLMRQLDRERNYRRSEEAKWKARVDEQTGQLAMLDREREQLKARLDKCVEAGSVASLQVSLNNKVIEAKRRERKIEQEREELQGELAQALAAKTAAEERAQMLQVELTLHTQVHTHAFAETQTHSQTQTHTVSVAKSDVACECNEEQHRRIGRLLGSKFQSLDHGTDLDSPAFPAFPASPSPTAEMEAIRCEHHAQAPHRRSPQDGAAPPSSPGAGAGAGAGGRAGPRRARNVSPETSNARMPLPVRSCLR
jgi:hypothetical protein